MRRLRGLVVAALVGALAVVGAVVPTSQAEAAVGVVLSGRGFGHGHGLSQYGAKGRAEAGQTYQQILAAYYPGTSLDYVSDSSTIRVWVQGDTDSEMWLRAEPGMTVSGAGRAIALPATIGGITPTLWRVRMISATLVVEGWNGSAWVGHGVPEITTALSGQTRANIAAPDGTVELIFGSTYRVYRGYATATRVGTGSTAVVRTVVTSTMASYLQSVVKAEMPAAWHAQALRAQAVAARSYALFDRASSPSGAWYDTCDTTSCQVFKGVRDLTSGGAVKTENEHPATTAAVSDTWGQTVFSGGAPAFTQFSASNGGHSAAGSRPYLAAAPDPYDAYPAWSVNLTGAQIAAAYPAIGSYVSVTVLARDGQGPWGGRATSVRITGTASSVTLTGNAFRTAFGLRSTLFGLTAYATSAAAPQRDWNVDGGADLIGRAPDGKLFLYRGLSGATWAKRVQIGNGWNTMLLMTQVHGFSGTNKPEIITTNAQGLLFLYPGNGTGGFGTPVRLGQGWWGFDRLVGVEGFHAPGQPGMLARKASTGQLLLYPGNGAGGFGAVRDLGTGWNSYDMILDAGDWDGDGYSDLMVRNKSTGALVLYRGNGRGGFLGSTQVGNGWGGMDEIVGAADWNRDGRYDLIAREDSTGNLWLYPGNGAGGFLPRQQVGYGWVGFALAK